MIALAFTFLLLASDAEPDKSAVQKQEDGLAQAFEAEVHISALPFKTIPAPVIVVTTPMISYTDKTGVHEALFQELPPPFQGIFSQWATATTDEPSGHALFDDMFHRFFFIHELGHWTTAQILDVRQDAQKPTAIANERTNHWQTELETNRIAVAWWREHDPAYLAKLVGDFRKIQAALPNPVPVGTDMQAYFAANYDKIGNDPNVYGWFLLQSVILAYDEPPKSFQQTLDDLAKYNFE